MNSNIRIFNAKTVGCTACYERKNRMHFLSWVNNVGMRASRGVIISAWWAEVNVTSYGSTRKTQLRSLRKKISGHKNYQAHKEAINILEIAKKDVLKTRAVGWKTVCWLCAFTYCQSWIHKVNKLSFNPLLEFAEQHILWQKITNLSQTLRV